MSTITPHLASHIYGRPLLLHPSTAALISEKLGERFGADHSPELAALATGASRFRGAPTDTSGRYRVDNGRAIIAITGELCNRGAWIGASSGLTSYEGISEQIRIALADPAVSSILLDVNSPGGEAVGAFECAAEIRAADAKKPVSAFVNGMAASAGYALASATRRIVLTPSSIVGSIGVVALHVDQSRRLDRQGVTPTLMFAGNHKVDGHSFAPLPDSVRSDMQAEIDKFYDMFVGTVARFRGMKADAVRATQARCYMGQDAVAAGLADAVGTLDDALAGQPATTFRRPPSSMLGPASRSIPATSYVPPAPAPKAMTSAELRAAQVEICTQVWRKSGRQAALSMGFPSHVMAEVGRAIQPGIDAAWSDIIGGLNKPSSGTPATQGESAPTASDLWDEVARVNGSKRVASGGAPPPTSVANAWDAATTALNAENDRVGRSSAARNSAPGLSASTEAAWNDVCAKLNANHGLYPKDA